MVNRFRVLLVLFIIGFIALVVRLFYWQIIEGKELSVKARGQYEIGQVVQAPRGSILASDSTGLATRQEAWLVYASLPNIKEDPQRIADKLAPFFVEDISDRQILLDEVVRLTALLSRNDVVWVQLKQKIEKPTKEAIEALEIEGIGFDPQEIRLYPESSSSAHLLGFVGKNDHGEDIGYFGLEGFYDLILSGKPGYKARESDARGIPILIGNSKEIFAVQGVDLITNIDKAVQITLERELKRGLEIYGASEGSGIIMNPKTGAVIAMASFPSYDPSTYSVWSNELFKNPTISNAFEPGSIFKVLVMAAGLDSGVVKPDTKCEICDKPIKIDKYYINTWNNEYNKDSSMTDVIVHSDNVGMVYVAQKMGKDKMYDYLSKFGMGKLTGIDLQGEVTPAIREKNRWSEIDLATSSFGQGIATTPIQIVNAVSAIANDGILLKPTVVKSLQGEGWQEDIKVEEVGRVISKKAADEITAMMVEAARIGESKWTYVSGFKVAGKTGTAQIPIEGHYDAEKTIASFVGFAPYDDPKFVMLITLKEPQSSQWASETAAPLWYMVAKDLFLYYGIQPTN
ncbi:penicillin-binding protein 2 [Candidatus Woesebacteria bacterium]|nr:MAG: penicillin-binding protein 2 [Candidatus Woesebacteria bacterium]